jgi:hypothetical protein
MVHHVHVGPTFSFLGLSCRRPNPLLTVIYNFLFPKKRVAVVVEAEAAGAGAAAGASEEGATAEAATDDAGAAAGSTESAAPSAPGTLGRVSHDIILVASRAFAAALG